MRLIQLNIWHGKLRYQIEDFLKAVQPDIVCMQEVNDMQGSSGSLFGTLAEFQEATGLEHSFMAPTHSYTYMHRQVGFGNAMLSRFAFTDKETTFTHGSFINNYDLITDDFNVRNFQHAVLRDGEKQFHVINYHGYLVSGSKDGNDETLRHTQFIADYIKKLSGPVILAGDFNLAPPSESMQIFQGLLRNLSTEFELKTTYTKFNIHDVVCDYILVNDKVTVRNFVVAEDLVSDHKPLILDFEI